jgi:predicted helicase
MRDSLLKTFDDIYVLDLHGNSKKKEKAPGGSADENVFDIQQGVSIGFFVRRASARKAGQRGTLHHAEQYGLREQKYDWLWHHDVFNTKWQPLAPQSPQYLAVPQDTGLLAEYEAGWKITDAMPLNSVGIVTARDSLTIHFSKEDAWRTVQDFAMLPVEEAREKYQLGQDARDWQVLLAQQDLIKSGLKQDKLVSILYRPFDSRHTYYTGNSRGFHCMPRSEVMQQLLDGKNLALITSRLTKGEDFQHVQVADSVVEVICMSPKTSNNGFVFPLYHYSAKRGDLFEEDDPSLSKGKQVNLMPAFVEAITAKLKVRFVAGEGGDFVKTVGAEDIFHYLYAILYSPTYRSRYKQFLRLDFPRIPITSNSFQFRTLALFGKKLMALHLMREAGTLASRFPQPGNGLVDKVSFHTDAERLAGQTPAGSPDFGRVYVNSEQYFEGVPTRVWNYHIGGYQVCAKWLKDRKGRQLSYDDITHYHGIVAALNETIDLQAQIDAAITSWPIQ